MPLALPGKTKRRWWPRPRTKLGKVSWWSLLAVIVFWPLEKMHNSAADIFGLLWLLAWVVLICAGIPWTIRWIRRRLLWRLRNRLVVTYLLVGLAPFALLTILFGLIGYMLAGQFAVFAASDELDHQATHMATETSEFALHLLHMDAAAWRVPKIEVPEAAVDPNAIVPARTLNIFRDGALISTANDMPPPDPSIQATPKWLGQNFTGIVRDHGSLFVRAVSTRQLGEHSVTVISSEPLSSRILARAAEGLGVVTIVNFAVHQDEGKQTKDEKDAQTHESVGMRYSTDSGTSVSIKTPGASMNDADLQRRSLSGGVLAPKSAWYDINVSFLTLLSVKDWANGDAMTTTLSVASRPSLLYHRLFSSSILLGAIIRGALIGIAILFALIELVALLMAGSLNRSITRSIANLYQATVRVDSGDLTHQIAVRQNDQLGQLSHSFNQMTASMLRLLAESKEKERLQNELNIAQEVQANLFPAGDVAVSSLEVHGVCRPARTVSGDYYDFLMFGPTSLGLALGDISGKGISAALLMATLHSAVRAYRFAAEELVDAEMVANALRRNGAPLQNEIDCADMFQSPGKILSLLNRHLYRSTQPEKYATLWLGHYDGTRSRLTYSNGGQLPPLVLCTDGEVKRLDRGGTVVGLIDGCVYDEGTVTLSSGDIVIAYSDGVTEPENDFGDFGEDRLVDIVRQHRTASLETISSHVMQSLTDWIGGQEQPDDITLVLARQL